MANTSLALVSPEPYFPQGFSPGRQPRTSVPAALAWQPKLMLGGRKAGLTSDTSWKSLVFANG